MPERVDISADELSGGFGLTYSFRVSTHVVRDRAKPRCFLGTTRNDFLLKLPKHYQASAVPSSQSSALAICKGHG